VPSQFHVEIVAVEAKVWSGEAEMVIARTTEGEIAILAGHTPLMGQLAEPSRVRVKVTGSDEIGYDVTGGFLSVTGDSVTVLAEDCRPAEGPAPVPASATAAAAH
jgi:F-type H+-transporting ATPase subunit epsilon